MKGVDFIIRSLRFQRLYLSLQCDSFIYIFGLGIFYALYRTTAQKISRGFSVHIRPKPIWNCRKLEKFSAFFIY